MYIVAEMGYEGWISGIIAFKEECDATAHCVAYAKKHDIKMNDIRPINWADKYGYNMIQMSEYSLDTKESEFFIVNLGGYDGWLLTEKVFENKEGAIKFCERYDDYYTESGDYKDVWIGLTYWISISKMGFGKMLDSMYIE